MKFDRTQVSEKDNDDENRPMSNKKRSNELRLFRIKFTAASTNFYKCGLVKKTWVTTDLYGLLN